MPTCGANEIVTRSRNLLVDMGCTATLPEDLKLCRGKYFRDREVHYMVGQSIFYFRSSFDCRISKPVYLWLMGKSARPSSPAKYNICYSIPPDLFKIVSYLEYTLKTGCRVLRLEFPLHIVKVEH